MRTQSDFAEQFDRVSTRKASRLAEQGPDKAETANIGLYVMAIAIAAMAVFIGGSDMVTGGGAQLAVLEQDG